jgi:Ankyrin repeats (many copies)
LLSANASQPGNQEAPALFALLRAIASRDLPTAARLLAEAQHLARSTLAVGATRESATPYYFDQIAHYVYAGDSPLHVAAAAYQTAIAEVLLSKGADPTVRNRRGAEPLHYAADGIPGSAAWDPSAQTSIIDFLIKAGANPNAKDKSGVAPLHRAVRTRCSAAVRALLMNGANPIERNKSGSTPLHLAVQNTGRGATGSAESREEQGQIVRLLLEYGARASDENAAGRSVKDCVRADWIHALFG